MKEGTGSLLVIGVDKKGDEWPQIIAQLKSQHCVVTFQALHLLIIQPPCLLLVLKESEDGEHQSLHIRHC